MTTAKRQHVLEQPLSLVMVIRTEALPVDVAFLKWSLSLSLRHRCSVPSPGA